MNPPSSLGTIIAGEKRIALTADDLLWAGRAAAGEGVGSAKGAAAVLWTWASRLAVSEYESYGALVRAHSQPVSAIWLADGSKCRDPDGEWFGRSYTDRRTGAEVWPCSAARLAKRARLREVPWESLAPFIRNAVVSFAWGMLPNPVPRAVDFASGLPTKRGQVLLAKVGDNEFFTTAASRAWPAKYVSVVGPDGAVASDAENGAVGALVVAGVAAAAYAAWRAWGPR